MLHYRLLNMTMREGFANVAGTKKTHGLIFVVVKHATLTADSEIKPSKHSSHTTELPDNLSR